MKLGEIIKNYRKTHHITLVEFSKRSGISVSYLSLLERGDIPKTTGKEVLPSQDIVKKAAKAMLMDYMKLMSMLDDDVVDTPLLAEEKRFMPIPLYSEVSCGHGLFVDNNIDDYVAIPDRFIKPKREYFAMTAKGNSMIGKGIMDSDVVVFEKTDAIENGQMGCFCVDDNVAVCKIYRVLDNGLILLESANEDYSPIVVDVTTNICFKVVGRYICRVTV